MTISKFFLTAISSLSLFLVGNSSMSITSSKVFEHIAQNIKQTIKPTGPGYDKGIDVTRFFDNQIKSYSNYHLLIKDLESNGFIISKKKDTYGPKLIASYSFYTTGIIKRIRSSIIIEINISKHGEISTFKSIYFLHMYL